MTLSLYSHILLAWQQRIQLSVCCAVKVMIQCQNGSLYAVTICISYAYLTITCILYWKFVSSFTYCLLQLNILYKYSNNIHALISNIYYILSRYWIYSFQLRNNWNTMLNILVLTIEKRTTFVFHCVCDFVLSCKPWLILYE